MANVTRLKPQARQRRSLRVLGTHGQGPVHAVPQVCVTSGHVSCQRGRPMIYAYPGLDHRGASTALRQALVFIEGRKRAQKW